MLPPKCFCMPTCSKRITETDILRKSERVREREGEIWKKWGSLRLFFFCQICVAPKVASKLCSDRPGEQSPEEPSKEEIEVTKKQKVNGAEKHGLMMSLQRNLFLARCLLISVWIRMIPQIFLFSFPFFFPAMCPDNVAYGERRDTCRKKEQRQEGNEDKKQKRKGEQTDQKKKKIDGGRERRRGGGDNTRAAGWRKRRRREHEWGSACRNRTTPQSIVDQWPCCETAGDPSAGAHKGEVVIGQYIR